MNCLSCGTPHDPIASGRFCARCGIAVQAPRPAAPPGSAAPAGRPSHRRGRDPEEPARCAECAHILDPPDAIRCGRCGARTRTSDLP